MATPRGGSPATPVTGDRYIDLLVRFAGALLQVPPLPSTCFLDRADPPPAGAGMLSPPRIFWGGPGSRRRGRIALLPSRCFVEGLRLDGFEPPQIGIRGRRHHRTAQHRAAANSSLPLLPKERHQGSPGVAPPSEVRIFFRASPEGGKGTSSSSAPQPA